MRNQSVAARSIVFVVNILTHGGAEVQVVRLAIGLKRRGWDVAVVAMVQPDSLEDQLREGGVELYCLGMTPGVPNPLAILKLRRFLRSRRPQVVHSHILHANLLSRVTRLITEMPTLVCTAHSMKEGSRWHELGYRLTDRLADLTTNVSQAAVDRYVRERIAPAHRIRFVANGLDLTRFRPNPESRTHLRDELGLGSRFTWLATARLEPTKDFPNLFRAFALASERDSAQEGAGPILLVAGGGRLEVELREYARQLGLSQRVRFLGVREDVCALMNAADAQVLSSTIEGMPLVLQEASASGLPIVATDVGGNKEVVLADHSGLLVPSGDSIALSVAMLRIMQMTPAQRAAMGRAGRQHVESRYGIEHVLDEWESIYRDLLAA